MVPVKSNKYMKIKQNINKSANFLWIHRNKIAAGVVALSALAASIPWTYQDEAKKVKEQAPEVIEKIYKEGGKRTNDTGELKLVKVNLKGFSRGTWVHFD